MRLTHVEVAFILNITQQEAIKKIICITEKNPHKANHLLDMTKKISVDSDEFDIEYGTSLTFAAKDIVENCLNRNAYKKWLMHDWPLDQLEKEKPTKKIQLPVALRRLIKPEDREIIKRYWEQNFSDYVSSNWTKKYTPVFEV
jgi:hypothetical protein